MEEEELKIETHSILCPHCKKVFRIDDVAKMYIEEGQLAERQRCLEIIEECFEKINVRTASGKQRMPICVLVELKQVLTKKINEVEK
jgi:hypothetical protein